MSAIAVRPALGNVNFANPNRARWATVRVETEDHVYVGRIYVSEMKKRVSDVLSDERPFLSLVDVTVDGAETVEEYLAVNKRYIHTVRVMDEGRVTVAAAPMTA